MYLKQFYYRNKTYQYCIVSENIRVPDSIINSQYHLLDDKKYKRPINLTILHFHRKSVVEPDRINQKGLYSLYNTLDNNILLSLTEKLFFIILNNYFTSLENFCVG